MKIFLFISIFLLGATGCSQVPKIDLSIVTETDAVVCEYFKHHKNTTYSVNRVNYVINELKKRGVTKDDCINLTKGNEGVYRYDELCTDCYISADGLIKLAFHATKPTLRNDLINKLKDLQYYKKVSRSMVDFSFYKALILFLYDEGECNLANMIEEKSGKFPFAVVHNDEKSSIFCENNYLNRFKLNNLNLSFEDTMSRYIYNADFYNFLNQSSSRIR